MSENIEELKSLITYLREENKKLKSKKQSLGRQNKMLREKLAQTKRELKSAKEEAETRETFCEYRDDAIQKLAKRMTEHLNSANDELNKILEKGAMKYFFDEN